MKENALSLRTGFSGFNGKGNAVLKNMDFLPVGATELFRNILCKISPSVYFRQQNPLYLKSLI